MIILRKKLVNRYAILPIHVDKIERLLKIESVIDLEDIDIVSITFIKKCLEINPELTFKNACDQTKERIKLIKRQIKDGRSK
jgi:hypothetical protein